MSSKTNRFSHTQVDTEEYGSPEVTVSDKESFTLRGTAVVNDLYENVNVAENRTDVER